MAWKVFTSETLTAADINDYLAEQANIIVTSVTRPTGQEGMQIGESDTNKRYVHDGTAWALDGGFGFVSFTPTWTNLTIGNGTQTGYYRYADGGMWVYIDVTFGSTSSISGGVTMTLPNSESVYSTVVGIRQPFGLAEYYDDSGSSGVEGVIRYNSSTSVAFLVRNAAGTYVTSAALSSTVPFTWATSDIVNASFFVPINA